MFALDMAANAVEWTDVGVLARTEVRQIVRCKDVDYTTIDQGVYPGMERGSISANNDVAPFVQDVKKFLGVKSDKAVKVYVVEAPQHGKLYPDQIRQNIWGYLPDSEYKGQDRVVFLAEANGKQMRFILNLLVGVVHDDNYDYRCRFETFEPVRLGGEQMGSGLASQYKFWPW